MNAEPDALSEITPGGPLAVPGPDGSKSGLAPLHAVEGLLSRFSSKRTILRSGGRIDEISPSHFRVRGMSGNARLGDLVEHRSNSGVRTGEIVRIGPEHVLVAPYERNADAGIGDPVFIQNASVIAPHPSSRAWKAAA